MKRIRYFMKAIYFQLWSQFFLYSLPFLLLLFKTSVNKFFLLKITVFLQELKKIVSDSIKDGCIKPICRVVFGTEEAEKAFRFMAAGKHIGKVLLKIREEETERTIIPKQIQVQAIPRYHNKSKYNWVFFISICPCVTEI